MPEYGIIRILTELYMISIIYPIYNVEAFLAKSIESILSQNYSDFEIIAINDGSTDRSYEIALKYASQDNRIKLFNQPNKGVSETRAIAISRSIGEYLVFVDSDDCLPRNALANLLNNIGNVDIVVGSYLENYNNQSIRRDLFNLQELTSREYLNLILSEKIQWGLWAKLYKKSLFIGTVVPPFKLGEDVSLLVQAIVQSNRVKIINDCVYNYNYRIDSAVNRKVTSDIVDVYLFRIWISDYLKKCYLLSKKEIDDIETFIVKGYIKCLLRGGAPYLLNEKYHLNIITSIYSNLLWWERLILKVKDHRIMLDIVVAVLNLLLKFKQKVSLLIANFTSNNTYRHNK